MTKSRFTATTLTALLVVALVAGATVPATATHDPEGDSTLGEALDAPADALSTAFGVADGAVSRAAYAISGPEEDATTNRDAAIEAFNEHNTTLVEYANSRDIHEGDVAAIDCTIDGETATAFIVAEYNNSTGAYESAEAVASTDRTVDHEIELRGPACDNAAAEIETFNDRFASEDKDVTRQYLAKKGMQYGDHVDEPFTGSDE